MTTIPSNDPGATAVAETPNPDVIVEELHPDDAELLRLEKEAEDEAAALAAGGGQPPADDATTPPAAPAGGGEDGSGKPAAATPGDSQMIPKGRLDDALAKQRKAEQAAAYWQGRAESGTGKPDPKPGDAPAGDGTPAPAPKSRAEIDARLLELADAFDEGKMSLKQVETERVRLHAQRDQLILDEADQRSENRSIDAVVNNPVLAARTNDLATANAWFKDVPDDVAEAQEKVSEALLKKKGIVIQDAAGILMLRTEMVKALAGAGWGTFVNPFDKKGVATPPAPAPGAPAKPTGQAATTADKLRLAANQPPSTVQTGRTGVPTGDIDEEASAALSEDELANLPDSALEKLAPSGRKAH